MLKNNIPFACIDIIYNKTYSTIIIRGNPNEHIQCLWLEDDFIGNMMGTSYTIQLNEYGVGKFKLYSSGQYLISSTMQDPNRQISLCLFENKKYNIYGNSYYSEEEKEYVKSLL